MRGFTSFDIVNNPLEGAQLIEASAGTGKTYAIAGLYLRLIIEKKLPVEEILVVTFTEAATAELRGRIRSRLRQALTALESGLVPADDELLAALCARHCADEAALITLRDSLRDFDRAAVHTIHGFCRRALREHAFESGASFDAGLRADISRLKGEIADDFWRMNFYSVSPHILHHAMQKNKKFGPGYFMGLLRGRPLDPSMKVVPPAQRPEASRMEEAFRALDEAFDAVREGWRRDGEAVRDMLLASSGKELSGNSYRSASIPKWCDEMGSYVEGGMALAAPDHFDRFTRTTVESSVKKGGTAPRHAFFDLCEALEARIREASAVADGFLMSLGGEFLAYASRELSERARRENTRSFDDLLESMHRALAAGEDSDLAVSMRKRFKAALIDEFQDTDPVQYAIFSTIFGAGSILFLIGDPKQAIYGFRGADIFAYMRASQSVSARRTLDVNHRASPGLVAAINSIFSRAEDPFVFREIGFHAVEPSPRKGGEEFKADGGAPLRLWFLEAEDKEKSLSKGEAAARVTRAVASEIYRLVADGQKGKALLKERGLSPGDIAVLTRTNDQARDVQIELSRYGIPGVIYGAESVFESREAAELARLLESIAAPGSDAGIRAALATGILGSSGNALLSLMEDEEAWDARRALFQEYHGLWERFGFIRMFRSLLDRERVAPRLLSLPDGERRMTNLLHLAEILHRTERTLRPGMEGLAKWLHERRLDPGESDEEQLRLETDEKAVKLHTVHRSKGLEYPIVFCPFLWEGSRLNARRSRDTWQVYTFHDESQGNIPVLDIGSGNDEYQRAAEREALAENLRLMYVALTRAKHRCYMAWGKINLAESSAPAYLFHSEGIDRSDILGSLSASMKLKSAAALRAELEALASGSGGAVSIEDPPAEAAGVYRPGEVSGEKLECRPFYGHIARDWRITSYSSMIAGRPAEEERDFGEEGPFGSEPEAQPGRTDIFSFPRGTRAGRLIHSLFERCDFSDFSRHGDLVASLLREEGFEERWTGPLCGMLRNVLAAPLQNGSPRFSLADVAQGERLHELEFYFPLGGSTARDIADAFRTHGRGDAAEFASEIEGLGSGRLRGFMRGFIDLVFRHGGRFYIVDWKSNHLGDAACDYTQERMKSAMRRHYYILQYHLYMVALDRYLAARLRDYRYESHFGGVFYMFVRGVDPADGRGLGIYRDRPGEGLAGALRECLGGEGRG